MAQHILIKLFKQKKFRDIEAGIEYAFKRSQGYMKTSMQYRYINDQDGDEVYLINRLIPEGIVAGDNTGTFEIHYNKKGRKINNIFLVA